MKRNDSIALRHNSLWLIELFRKDWTNFENLSNLGINLFILLKPFYFTLYIAPLVSVCFLIINSLPHFYREEPSLFIAPRLPVKRHGLYSAAPQLLIYCATTPREAARTLALQDSGSSGLAVVR